MENDRGREGSDTGPGDVLIMSNKEGNNGGGLIDLQQKKRE